MPEYKSDQTGRSTARLARSRDKKNARQWPDEQFVQFGQSLLCSPAWKVLSISAIRVFLRLHIEHLRHGGKENGRLPCTYSNFESYGVRRKAISMALDELEALGFIEIIRKGHLRPEGNSGAPSLYRITCLSVYRPDGVDKPTNEWRRFDSIASAKEAVLHYHEKASAERVRKYQNRTRNSLKISSMKVFSDENLNPRGVTATDLGAKTPLQ